MEDVERVMPGTESWDKYGLEHIQRYKYFDEFYKGKAVLDAACGTGYGSKHVSDSGAGTVLGIDVSDEAIRFAGRYKKDSLNYKLHDCMDLVSLNEKFDLVISFETIEHLSKPEEFMRQVSQVLNKGGKFICSTPNKARLSGAGNINPFHPSELEYKEFKTIFSKYFTVDAEYQQSESVEYFRYMEMKHAAHLITGRMESYFFNRIEKFFRKMLGKEFKYDAFMRNDLENLYEGDMSICELKTEPLPWHKTYIIAGTLK